MDLSYQNNDGNHHNIECSTSPKPQITEKHCAPMKVKVAVSREKSGIVLHYRMAFN